MDLPKKSRIPTRVHTNDEQYKYLGKENVGVGPTYKSRSSTVNLKIPVPRHRILSDTALLPPRKKIKIAQSTADKISRLPLGDLDGNTVKKNLVEFDTNVQKKVRIVKTVSFKNVDTAATHIQKKVEEITKSKKVTNSKYVYQTNTCCSKSTQFTNYEVLPPKPISNESTTSNQDLIAKTPEYKKPFTVDKKFVTVRQHLTPHPKIFLSKDDSFIEEVFVDSSKHFITFKHTQYERNVSSQINQTDGTYFSPIKPNKYTANTTVIFKGILDEVRRPAKKTTLCHKMYPRSKQGNSVVYCLDIYNTEYLDDIVRYQLTNDWKYVLNMNYLNCTNPNSMQNRTIIIDWLIKIQDYLNLSPTVLFATIRLFDRVLENISVACNMYQLVGLVIMWTVNKYEDAVNILTASKMLALCNGAYTNRDFLKMEQKLLKFFNFDFQISDVAVYVAIYLRKLELESDILLHSTFYILECFTLNVKFSTVIPSLQAAAAVRLALKILHPNSSIWLHLKDTLLFYSDENLDSIMEDMLQQVHIIQDPEYEHRQPYHKYAQMSKIQVSIVLLRKLIAT